MSQSCIMPGLQANHIADESSWVLKFSKLISAPEPFTTLNYLPQTSPAFQRLKSEWPTAEF